MSALSSLGLSGRLQVNGLVTGLDTDKLITGLLSVKQAQISRLEFRQQDVTTQLSSFKTVEARLVTLQSKLTQLGRSQNSVFDARKVTSSDDDLVAAAATSAASPGSYSFRINNLARTHQIASQGFDSSGDAITQGTLVLGIGGATTTITIDGTNNTVQGLVGAINSANAGVTASLVNDGRGHPYRVLLSSTKSGAANAITLTNNLAASGGGAIRPDFAANAIGSATTGSANTSTSVATSGGTFTGTQNTTYTLTVTAGGTVGTDNGITLSYSNSSGTQTGTLTLNAADVDTFQTLAEGIQAKFAAGTLVVGDTFKIDTSVATVQTATDASVTLGSGSGALTLSSTTNLLDGVIPGLTLDLKGADSTRDVTINVANDTEAAKDAILDFVDSYNEFLKTVDAQVRFDVASQKGGPLLGNQSVLSIQEQVRSTTLGTVAGLPTQINRLGALGLTTDDKGLLQVNTTKLDSALSGSTAGVAFADIRRLFTLSGESTNAGVQFVTGSSRTKLAGTAVDVEITQAARQASLTAANDLAASTTITDSGTPNNQFNITVDGQTATITLANGVYSRTALAQAVQAQLNASEDLSGHPVSVSLSGNKLKIVSSAYGSTSEVTLTSGNALTSLGFTAGQTAKGQDVVGKFLVDGQIETATGSGQFLVGNFGNANTADLQVRITLTDGQLNALSSEATLTVTRGVASRLENTVSELLDPISGRLKAISTSFQERIDSFEEDVEEQNANFEAQRQALISRFAALEITVSQLRTAGDLLTAQAANFRNLRNR